MEKIINFEERNQQGELIRARFVKPVVDEKIPLVIMLTGDGPRGSNSMSSQTSICCYRRQRGCIRFISL